METTIKAFPTLYKRDSKGRVQTWDVFVTKNGVEGFYIKTKHGKQGGKIQETADLITEGKNLGRTNETTPEQQAISEAESKWTKQIERKGYVDDPTKVDTDTRPGAEAMLAHRFDKYPHKIVYPCFIQPKLDGHRCLAVVENGAAKLFSRQRKPITGLPHITDFLGVKFPEGKIILDGELYNHDYKNKFEELTGFIRSEEPKVGHGVVQYHVYDIVSDEPQVTRLQSIEGLLGDYFGETVKVVETKLVEDEEQVLFEFKKHRKAGYEGSILRNYTGVYEGKRSHNLQKVKEFDDAEFEIVGVTEGRGKMAGHAIFVCQTPDGHKFEAKMKGSMENLKEYFENAEKYIGRIVTVQFQGYTGKNNVPRFPVAIRFREDL